MAINVKDKLVTLESLGVAYSAEQDAREEADHALSTRIDNIVAPEGDPSLTEVSDARVSGSTTHNTLKSRLDADNAAINTEIAAIKADLDAQVADLSQIGAMSIIPIVWNNGYIDSYGVIKGTTGNGRYSNQFYVDSGKVITLVGQGHNQAIAMICKVVTDGELYTPFVMSEDSTERIYKYVVTESGYYAVCVAGITSGNKLLVGYNFDATSDNDPFETTLTKHNFNVTANTSITEYFNYTASKGDKLALKLDIGFFDARSTAWYYKDRGGNSHLITTTVLYIPYLFEAPEDITAIGIYIGKVLVPASATYTISVRKLSVLGVIPNDVYIEPSDGLYATVKGITDCDRYNPYYIHLAKGTYDVSSEFTQSEIENAEYSMDGFVGLCLTDGMYLIGEGEKESIIVSCEISTDYSVTIRNQISTLNTKGDCGAENITFKSNNIRYAVHDDYTHSSNSKHVFKNCDFVHTNGTGSFAYGNGMNSGLSVELVDCVFVPSVLSHLTASTVGWPKGSKFVLKNCKAEKATIRNNDTKIKCIANFINCEIGTIEYTDSISTQYLTVEGTGTNALFSAPNGTVYAVGDIHKVVDNNYAVGMCLDYAKSLTNSNPYWIVVGVDYDYAYLQRSGYVSSNILGITAGNVGDYWTINSGYIVTGGTSANAVAKVVAVANGEAFAQIL